MSLLTDSEKVEVLISVLDKHIEQLPREVSLANYLESIRFFLKTKDPIIQKSAISTGDIFIENLSFDLRTQISLKQAVGVLVGAFDKTGYSDAMDVASVILNFEALLNQMSAEEAQKIYDERWAADKKEPSLENLTEYLETYLTELRLELQHHPTDQFVQGKLKGVQHALKMASHFNFR